METESELRSHRFGKHEIEQKSEKHHDYCGENLNNNEGHLGQSAEGWN
jgi:hypothetical protein